MADTAQTQDLHEESWLEGILRGFHVVRLPFWLAVATIPVFTLPEQLQELYRILMQAIWPPLWLLAAVFLTALSLVLWQVARQFADDHRVRGVAPHPAGQWVNWAPNVIAGIPMLGPALGLYLTRQRPVERTDLQPLQGVLRDLDALNANFTVGIYGCLALAVLLVTFTALLDFWVGRSLMVRLRRPGFWVVLVVAIASIVAISLQPVALPQLLGAIPIFVLWTVLLALLITLLTRLTVLGVPILGVLVVLAIVIEYYGLADNHAFRRSKDPPRADRPAVGAVFRQWLEARADLADYEKAGKPYPVFVVAAEGGGLYAAYHAAQFLTRMQDLCPNFSQHVFAISGVSGGSLGAAVFAALAKQDATNQASQPCRSSLPGAGELQARANHILSADLLSPIVWSGLFPDFLQRFIPQPILDFDRGVALEEALERAWHRDPKAGANQLGRFLYELCGEGLMGCSRGATPILALNVTNVETGMQMVLSPVDFRSVGPPWTKSRRIYDVFSSGAGEEVDIRLSTAVGLSARFPWLSPPGWHTYPDASRPNLLRRMSYVDGGYVDNSGVVTGLSIAQFIRELLVQEKSPRSVTVTLIMISAAWLPFERTTTVEKPQNKGQGELIAPLAAAFNAWQGRGVTTQFDASTEEDQSFKVAEAAFYYNYMALPLGWQMSQLSRKYINLFAGDPERCDESKLGLELESHAALANSHIERSHCLMARLIAALTPGAPPAPPGRRQIAPSR